MSDQNLQDKLSELQQLYDGGGLSKELYLAAIKGLGLDPTALGVMDASLEGGGAIAQGEGAVAAGAGGLAVGGDIDAPLVFFGKDAHLENVQIQLRPDTAKALQNTLCDAVESLDKKLYEKIRRFERKPPEEPYRYLYSFDTEHIAVFKGRDTARKALLEKICADGPESRLTLLHSPSGAGKTSLLRAAIVPELAYDSDYLPVYVDHPREPVSRIKQVILPKNLYPEEVEKLSLQSFLKATVPGLDRKTFVILLDQFEEFFIQLKPQQRQPFIRALADCYHDRDLPVKFVLSMRKEYYANMTEFDGEIKRVFDNYFSLGALTTDEAKSAIEEPLKDFGMSWELGAVETLLNYLGDEISPPHLQLICSRLYEKAKDEERSTISVEGVSLEEIHANFLTQEMKAEDFLPHHRELGWRLLKELVTSERTKQVLSLTALYEIASRYKGASREEVDAVLERLVNRRVLRQRKDEIVGETLIELAHDTLATEIDKHRTDQERREKDANDLVERELATWRQYKREPGYLMSKPELMLLDRYRQDLINPGPEALEFLFLSALAANHSVRYWFTRAEERGGAAKDILKERLESDVSNIRAGAATTLGELQWEDGIPWLSELLEDDYTHVRARAWEALLKIGTPQALQVLEEHDPRGMIYIPAGEFIMGEGDETHTVDLPAYYIGEHMVTNAEYKQFVESTGYHSPHHWPDDKMPEDIKNHPVVDVTWFDALEYARWAGMRLPTEAEWEKAARGTDGRRFPWGNEFDSNKCNVEASNINHTTEVGANSPDGNSPYGCTDMASNVWQWTSSLIREYPYNPDDDRENLEVRDKRMIRGASFSSKLDRVPVAYRNDRGYQADHSHNLGFRCALSPATSLSKLDQPAIDQTQAL